MSPFANTWSQFHASQQKHEALGQIQRVMTIAMVLTCFLVAKISMSSYGATQREPDTCRRHRGLWWSVWQKRIPESSIMGSIFTLWTTNQDSSFPRWRGTLHFPRLFLYKHSFKKFLNQHSRKYGLEKCQKDRFPFKMSERVRKQLIQGGEQALNSFLHFFVIKLNFTCKILSFMV